jgi:hypothetical protein
MEVNMTEIILTSTFLSAFFVGFFLLGFYFGTKAKTKEDAFVVKSKEDIENLKGMAEWLNFGGK